MAGKPVATVPPMATSKGAVTSTTTQPTAPTKPKVSNNTGHRVQRSLIFQPTLRASCSQDVLARRSFLVAGKFSVFYIATVN